MSINRVMISGNLTRDPELRSTAGGTSVLNFGVAVNDRRKNQQTGEWEEYANFINCVMFGKRADALAQYLTKGQKVAIEGKLSYSQWESQQGEKRSKVEVLVDEIEFMSSRGEGGGGGSGRTFAAPTTPDLPSDDEIPF
jgi:single-strand DNA-binding protein